MAESIGSGPAYPRYLVNRTTGAAIDPSAPVLAAGEAHIGQVGGHTAKPSANFTRPNAANVNAAIADTPNRLTNTAYVANTGYTDGGDSLHYDAASQRLIGAAMYTAYETI